jgi:hypothetical protein
MHPLLRALDHFVKNDGAPARINGNVIVAVKSASGTPAIWHAAFANDALLGCGYLAGVPRDADAILLFDEAQATDVADGKKPAGKVATFGDHALLAAFVDRYCTFRSFVDVRAGGRS